MGTPITGNEVTPTDSHGSWVAVEWSTGGTPITGNEVTPTDSHGSWTVMTSTRAGFRNLGLTRGARSVT